MRTRDDRIRRELEATDAVRVYSSPSLGTPAANQVPAALRMRRTGLAQSDGTGFRMSSIRKSPSASSATPATFASALDERSCCLANQRGENALVGVLADAVPAREQQPVAPHFDAPVEIDNRSKVADAPRAGSRRDTSHDILLHVRECSVGIRGSAHARHWNHADSTVEDRQRIALVRADTRNNSRVRRSWPSPLLSTSSRGFQVEGCSVTFVEVLHRVVAARARRHAGVLRPLFSTPSNAPATGAP